MNAASRLREKTIPFEVKLKRIIANMHLNCIGVVANVNSDGSRIDVNLPYLDCNNRPVTIKGIEVLRPGTHLVKIKIKPEVGDVVLLFAQQDYWAEATFAQQPTPKVVASDAYNDNTIKALLVQTNDTNANATLIDIKEDEIEITAPLKTTIVCKDAVAITAESTTDITCKDAVTITSEDKTDITCKDEVTITAESATKLTCKDTVTATCEKALNATCKDTVTATCEKALNVTCKGDATVDASGKNVTVKSSKVTINDHLEVS